MSSVMNPASIRLSWGDLRSYECLQATASLRHIMASAAGGLLIGFWCRLLALCVFEICSKK